MVGQGQRKGWRRRGFHWSARRYRGIKQDFEFFFLFVNINVYFHLNNFEKGSIFFINNWKCLVKTCICIQLVFNIFSCFESFICWTDGPVVEIKRYMINDYNGALEEFWGNLLVVWTVDVTSHPEWGLGVGGRVRPTQECTGTGKSERLVSDSSTTKIRTQALQQTAPIA